MLYFVTYANGPITRLITDTDDITADAVQQWVDDGAADLEDHAGICMDGWAEDAMIGRITAMPGATVTPCDGGYIVAIDLARHIGGASNLSELADALEFCERALTALERLGADHRDERDTYIAARADAPKFADGECDGPADGLGELISWDGREMLVDHDGRLFRELRGDTVHSLPAGWRAAATGTEASAIVGEDATIYMTSTGGTDGWSGAAVYTDTDYGDELTVSEIDTDTCGEAADYVTAGAVAWVLDTATPSQVVALLRGTQVEIAARLGVSQSTVSDWKNDRMEMSRMARHLVLCVLGCRYVTAESRWWIG